MTCPDCGAQPRGRSICAECGTSLDFHRNRRTVAAVLYAGLAVVVVVLFGAARWALGSCG
jgi:predicted nucleic acid-binding Zn ribbon protein